MKTLLAVALAIPVALSCGVAHGGGAAETASSLQVRYHLEKLLTLGGSSLGASINDRGWIAGRSNLPGGATRHAALWRNGQVTDLGTLGGPNSAVLWPVKNVRGIVVGIAQSDEPDPNNETWSCGYFFPANEFATGRRCFGFVWENNRMRALDTLGGTHGYATGANNLGQIVGWAENTVVDDTCTGDQIFQFRAAVWSRNGRVVRQLPPHPGDTASAATAINDRGQVVGISGECDIAFGQRTAMRAVMWENGQVRDLGNIGGDAWNTPTAINPQGDVVGFLNQLPGNDFVPEAFLWTRRDGLQPLGTLGEGGTSQASGINLWRQIVGQDCTAEGVCTGFVWSNGEMRDLQALVVSGDDLDLLNASDIDSFGRITGQAIDLATGTPVAYIATPKLVRR